MRTLNKLLACILLLRAVLGQDECALCPLGMKLTLPDRPFFALESRPTCGEMDEVFRTFNATECVEWHEGYIPTVDIEAFCGCEGVESPQLCTFCPGGNKINLDNADLRIPQSIFEVDMTCEEASTIEEFVRDPMLCVDFKLAFAPDCCDLGRGDQEGGPYCSICPEGSEIGEPDNPLFFLGPGVTCAEGDITLSGLSEENCALVEANFATLPFDVSTYCGCTGTTKPEMCAFCERSDFGKLVNDDEDVELGNNVTVTCAEADLLAPYINDPSVCDVEYEEAIRFCCEGTPTASLAPVPAPVTTPAPTFARPSSTSSAGRTKPLAGSVIFMLVILILGLVAIQ